MMLTICYVYVGVYYWNVDQLCIASLRAGGLNPFEKIHKYQLREEYAIAIRKCGSRSRPLISLFKRRYQSYF